MAIIRDGKQSVLLVVDMQVGVVQEAWERERVIGNVATAVHQARNHQIPIIWVQHSDEEFEHGSPEWQLVPELTPEKAEIRIDKHFHSSFAQTELKNLLANIGATHIVLAGASTNWCIRATAYSVLERGYDLTLLSDAHTTDTITFDGNLIEAEPIINDLNAVMSWLAYPNCTNQVIPVEKLDFTI